MGAPGGMLRQPLRGARRAELRLQRAHVLAPRPGEQKLELGLRRCQVLRARVAHRLLQRIVQRRQHLTLGDPLPAAHAQVEQPALLLEPEHPLVQLDDALQLVPAVAPCRAGRREQGQRGGRAAEGCAESRGGCLVHHGGPRRVVTQTTAPPVACQTRATRARLAPSCVSAAAPAPEVARLECVTGAWRVEAEMRPSAFNPGGRLERTNTVST